jgi:hypothetical protein
MRQEYQREKKSGGLCFCGLPTTSRVRGAQMLGLPPRGILLLAYQSSTDVRPGILSPYFADVPPKPTHRKGNVLRLISRCS